jgi:hypothetical protein
MAYLQVREVFQGQDAQEQPTNLLPAFVHRQGSRACYNDELTESKESPDQVKIALGLAADFKTKAGKTRPRLGCPRAVPTYAANVELINRMRKAA